MNLIHNAKAFLGLLKDSSTAPQDFPGAPNRKQPALEAPLSHYDILSKNKG